jgi:HTH-like domain
VRDGQLKAAITRLHQENYGVYGAPKVWLALNRQGVSGGPVHASEAGVSTIRRALTYLPVGESLGGQLGDLQFLRGQRGYIGAARHLLGDAGRPQFTDRALREASGTKMSEDFVRRG